jgi:hypothetical protein
VPAQQVDPFIPWLMQTTGAKTFYLPSADYIWPRVMNQKVREVVTASGGTIVGEEYFPMDHTDYRATVDKISSTGADVVFNTTVPPGVASFLGQLHASGFAARGGQLVCTYFDENFLNMVPPALIEGLYSCLDYYQAVSDPFSRKLLAQYDALYPGTAKFTAGSACTGRAAAVGGGRDRGRVARPGQGGRGARSGADCRGAGRAGRHGARRASRAHEHVHRAGARRPLRDREEPRGDRAEGAACRRDGLTAGRCWPRGEREPRRGRE